MLNGQWHFRAYPNLDCRGERENVVVRAMPNGPESILSTQNRRKNAGTTDNRPFYVLDLASVHSQNRKLVMNAFTYVSGGS